MSEIPPDLYSDILSRVFVESLLRFRCVCKAWRRIIDDPAFIKLHLHRQSDSGQLILFSGPGTKHYTLSLDSLNDCSSKSPTRTVVASPFSTWFHIDLPRMSTLPLPSCNGLILINSIGKTKISAVALWNPFTREVHELPPQEDRSIFYGLGYDSVTDDYKVVKIPIRYNPTTGDVSWEETLVYSLKSNSWKRAKNYPYHLLWPMLPGVFVNGALHWVSFMKGNNELMIVAFDLATEDYYTLPLPSLPFTPRWPTPNILLCALGECLVLTLHDSVYRLDDYGGKNLWTKLFSFSSIGLRDLRPIAYSKTKAEVLLLVNANEYICFDIEKEFAKKVTIDRVPAFRSSLICMASLVRLGNSDGVDGSSAAKGTGKKKNRSSMDRLKISL